MMMKTGKINKELTTSSFQLLYGLQQVFQHTVTGLEVPVDNVNWFQYHMTAMTEELGEVLKADKRWKTHRNVFYDPANKLEELADVFVTAMNLAIFSGFDADQMLEAISAKLSENIKKLEALNSDSNS